jgi:luciferase family oxidoreductase group 1
MRRDVAASDQFPDDVLELQALLGDAVEGQAYRAVPGEGTHIPLWILGSSLYGAQLAAMLGLPYAFASHFAPDALVQALEVYRARFRPSAQAARPYAVACVNVVVAETDAEAKRLFTTIQQRFVSMVRGTRGKLQPPIDDIETYWSPLEKAQASRMLARSFVGSRETVRQGLEAFIAETGVDELMVACALYDHQARLRSYELLSQIALSAPLHRAAS